MGISAFMSEGAVVAKVECRLHSSSVFVATKYGAFESLVSFCN